jgi:IS30 family transposase
MSRNAAMVKVTNKTFELVSSTIVDNLKPLLAEVKKFIFDNGQKFEAHAHMEVQLQSTAYFAIAFAI